jgi:TRAP-type C4-dicarboxylate transport system substrate-binding protein
MVGAAALALGATQMAAADTKLVYTSWFPGQSTLHTKVLTPFFERVAADSNGSISYELFTDGTVAGGRATLQAIRDGIADMGLIANLYYPAELRYSAFLSEGSTLVRDALVGAGAYNEKMLLNCPSCVSDFEEQNIVPIAFHATPPYVLMCNRPVTTAADMKGLRVRSVGAWAVWVDAAGGTSVNMTTQESYEALERGQIDCTIGNAAWLIQSSLFDVVSHVNTMKLGTYAGGVPLNMNRDTWADLDDAQREIIRRNAAGAIMDIALEFGKEDDEALAMAGDRKVTLIEPSEDLVALFARQGEAEVGRLLSLAAQRQVSEPDALLTKYRELLAKWEKIVDETGPDRDALAARLYDEVLAKLD